MNNKGVVLMAMGRTDEALETFNGAIAADPNNAVAWRNKAEALRAKDELEEALACLNESLRIRPDHRATLEFHHTLVAEIRRRHKCHLQ